MSVLRALHVYEILQIPMSPASTFLTHICQTLKNGTGFQATCINMEFASQTGLEEDVLSFV